MKRPIYFGDWTTRGLRAALLPARTGARTNQGARIMVHDEDIVAAKSTFKGFVSLITWGTVFSAIAGFIVILLIAPK